MAARYCRKCNASISPALETGSSTTPTCPYCGAWYPFGIHAMWISLAIIAALVVFALVK